MKHYFRARVDYILFHFDPSLAIVQKLKLGIVANGITPGDLSRARALGRCQNG